MSCDNPQQCPGFSRIRLDMRWTLAKQQFEGMPAVDALKRSEGRRDWTAPNREELPALQEPEGSRLLTVSSVPLLLSQLLQPAAVHREEAQLCPVPFLTANGLRGDLRTGTAGCQMLISVREPC